MLQQDKNSIEQNQSFTCVSVQASQFLHKSPKHLKNSNDKQAGSFFALLLNLNRVLIYPFKMVHTSKTTPFIDSTFLQPAPL